MEERLSCRGRRGAHLAPGSIGGEAPDRNRGVRPDRRDRGGGRPSNRAAASRPGRLQPPPTPVRPRWPPRATALPLRPGRPPSPHPIGESDRRSRSSSYLRAGDSSVGDSQDGTSPKRGGDFDLEPRVRLEAGRGEQFALGRGRRRGPHRPLTLGDSALDGAAAGSPP